MCLSCVRKAHMSSKKLLEQCQKLEKLWGHVLTGNYAASTQPATAATREITQKYPSQTTILSYIETYLHSIINISGTLQLHGDNWYTKVTDLLEKQQTAPIWMSDTKVTLAITNWAHGDGDTDTARTMSYR